MIKPPPKLLPLLHRPLIAGRSRRFWLIILLLLVVAVLVGMASLRENGLLTLVTVVTGKEVIAPDPRPVITASFRDGRPDMVLYSEGHHDGPIRAITEEAAERIGHRIEWVQASYGKSVRALKEGELDIIPFIFFKTAEREQEFWFSTSLGKRPRPVHFIVHKDSDAARNLKTFGDLKRYRIGQRKTSYYFKAFHDADHFQRLMYGELVELAQAFIVHQVDVMTVNDSLEANRLMTTLGYNDYAYAELKYEDSSDVYYFYSRNAKRTELLRKFDAEVSEMVRSGRVADIYSGYGVEPPQLSSQVSFSDSL
jgi:polar amino acid transport system substrate-binding protein